MSRPTGGKSRGQVAEARVQPVHGAEPAESVTDSLSILQSQVNVLQTMLGDLEYKVRPVSAIPAPDAQDGSAVMDLDLYSYNAVPNMIVTLQNSVNAATEQVRDMLERLRINP